MNFLQNVRYCGIDEDDADQYEPAMFGAIIRFAVDNPTLYIKVYPTERFDGEVLEWHIDTTSTAGRRSFTAMQRIPGGSVLISESTQHANLFSKFGRSSTTLPLLSIHLFSKSP